MIKYRSAEKSDSPELAQLVDIASAGVVEYLFSDTVAGMTPVQVVAYNLENDYYPHSFKSAIVAVEENAIVGMSLSYPSSYHAITDEMREFFPAERIDHLQDFFSACVVNSWYIDALAVFESHRKRGIGEELVTLTKERAIAHEFNTLSLIAFADNASAIRLYERTGFEVVRQVQLQPNRFIKHDEGCLLMKCDIDT